MSIMGSLQLQDLGAWVELYTLDLTTVGGPVYRFVPDTNGNRQAVTWQGNVFNPLPIKVTGYGLDSQGKPSRPKAQVGNGGGEISALMLLYDDLLGATLHRHRTKVMYLDAVNFPPRRNLVTLTENLGLWSKAEITTAQDGTLSPLGEADPVWLMTKTTTGTSKSVGRMLPNPTQTVQTTRILVRAGSAANVSLGLRQNSAWVPRVSARIVEGPGAVDGGSTALIQVTGLSASEWTTVEFQGAVVTTLPTQLYIYPAGSGSNVIGASTYVCYPQVEDGSVATDYQPVLGSTWSANPTADPNEHLPDDTYYVNQVTSETLDMVEFELTSPLELEGLRIPARTIQGVICTLEYRGEGCNYNGPAVADRYDNPTNDINVDACSCTMKGCKLRFPPPLELSFGAWPAAGKVPRY